MARLEGGAEVDRVVLAVSLAVRCTQSTRACALLQSILRRADRSNSTLPYIPLFDIVLTRYSCQRSQGFLSLSLTNSCCTSGDGPISDEWSGLPIGSRALRRVPAVVLCPLSSSAPSVSPQTLVSSTPFILPYISHHIHHADITYFNFLYRCCSTYLVCVCLLRCCHVSSSLLPASLFAPSPFCRLLPFCPHLHSFTHTPAQLSLYPRPHITPLLSHRPSPLPPPLTSTCCPPPPCPN